MDFLLLHIQWLFSGLGIALYIEAKKWWRKKFKKKSPYATLGIILAAKKCFWKTEEAPKNRLKDGIIPFWKIPDVFHVYNENENYQAPKSLLRKKSNDPVFEGTIHNNSDKSLILHGAAIEVVKAAQMTYGLGGGPGDSEEIKISKIFNFDCKLLAASVQNTKSWNGRFKYYTNLEVFRIKKPVAVYGYLDDPVKIKPDGSYRFQIILNDYTEYMPNISVIRIKVYFQGKGSITSKEILMDSGTVFYRSVIEPLKHKKSSGTTGA